MYYTLVRVLLIADKIFKFDFFKSNYMHYKILEIKGFAWNSRYT